MTFTDCTAAAHPVPDPSTTAPFPLLSTGERLMAWLGALTAAGSLFSALLLAFSSASPDVWLTPTPEVMQLAQRCDRQASRQDKMRCKQDLVAAHQARDNQTLRLAGR